MGALTQWRGLKEVLGSQTRQIFGCRNINIKTPASLPRSVNEFCNQLGLRRPTTFPPGRRLRLRRNDALRRGHYELRFIGANLGRCALRRELNCRGLRRRGQRRLRR